MSTGWNPPHEAGPWNSSQLFAEHNHRHRLADDRAVTVHHDGDGPPIRRLRAVSIVRQGGPVEAICHEP